MTHPPIPPERAALREKMRGYMNTPTDELWLDILVDGVAVRTCYLQAGLPPSPDSPPLVLLHGANTDGLVWFPVMAALAEKYTIFAPDIVGYGETDKPNAPYDRPYYARWLQGFLAALGHDKVMLLGLSMGGAIALQAALDFPDKLDRLILVGAAGLGKLQMPKGLPMAMTLLHIFPSAKAQDRVRRINHTVTTDERKITMGKYRLSVLKSKGSRRVFLRSAGRVTHRFTPDELARITLPTQIIWGEKDNTYPVQIAQETAKLIPHATLSIIPNAPHIPFWDDPAPFTQAVLSVTL